MELKGYAKMMFQYELEAVVGVENVSTNNEERKEKSIDQYWLTHMWKEKGQELPLPEYIVKPLNTEETSKVVKICNKYKIPMVVRGGGSGSAGGAATLYGGVIIDLSRMDKIIEIDNNSLILTAQAGINGRILEDELNKHDLMLAHYPSSVDIATLGGYLAARGSGVMSTKYGKAEDMVISVQVVLPNGDVMDTLTTPNHACGPGLLQLFVGSEGTLGIITTVKMRLERLPEYRSFNMFKFNSISEGIEAGKQIMLDRLNPAVIRLYDDGSTKKSLNTTGLNLEGTYMVIMCDGFKDMVDVQQKRIEEICISCGAENLGEELGKHWWDTRYVAYKPPVHPAFPIMYGTPETVTTFNQIETLYYKKKYLVEEQFKEWDAKYTAHFSHWYPWGAMIYDRFYVENPPEDPIEAFRLHNKIFGECSKVNLDNGAVLNEHHGIGFKLGYLMPEQYGKGFDVLLSIKKSLDPKGIMNPGKLGFDIW